VLYRVVGGVGRALIAVGTVVLLFVAYQLWGTGIHEARAQSDLVEEFERSLAAPAPSSAPEPDGGEPPLPTPPGGAVAVLRIPKIDMEKVVVEGVALTDLRKAPGHYPQTPMPGQPGNAAIAGHRTTYGAPFWDLDQLEPGDEILARTPQGEFRYEVARSSVVRPDQLEVLDQTDEARLTLTTCHPRFSAAQRLVVSAVLVDEPAAAPTTPPPPAPAEPDPADTDPVDTPAPGARRHCGAAPSSPSSWPSGSSAGPGGAGRCTCSAPPCCSSCCSCSSRTCPGSCPPTSDHRGDDAGPRQASAACSDRPPVGQWAP
jgi:sortase A